MDSIQGTPREQKLLFPDVIDDYIPEIKLYIYGYSNRVRSRRSLEKEAHRNIEGIRLLRKLRTDFKTIAHFRKENAKASKYVLRNFTLP